MSLVFPKAGPLVRVRAGLRRVAGYRAWGCRHTCNESQAPLGLGFQPLDLRLLIFKRTIIFIRSPPLPKLLGSVACLEGR